MKYRNDKDSLGIVKIPTNVYYGPFTGRAIKQYKVTGQNAHPYLIKSFVMIKRSAAITNMKAKALDRKQGNAIVKPRAGNRKHEQKEKTLKPRKTTQLLAQNRFPFRISNSGCVTC